MWYYIILLPKWLKAGPFLTVFLPFFFFFFKINSTTGVDRRKFRLSSGKSSGCMKGPWDTLDMSNFFDDVKLTGTGALAHVLGMNVASMILPLRDYQLLDLPFPVA